VFLESTRAEHIGEALNGVSRLESLADDAVFNATYDLHDLVGAGLGTQHPNGLRLPRAEFGSRSH
jgi:hypothetical protein